MDVSPARPTPLPFCLAPEPPAALGSEGTPFEPDCGLVDDWDDDGLFCLTTEMVTGRETISLPLTFADAEGSVNSPADLGISM